MEGELYKKAYAKRTQVKRYDIYSDTNQVVEKWKKYGGDYMYLKQDKTSVLLYDPYRTTCDTCEDLLEVFERGKEFTNNELKLKYEECKSYKFSFLNKCGLDIHGCDNILHNIENFDIYKFYIIWSSIEFIDFTNIE